MIKHEKNRSLIRGHEGRGFVKFSTCIAIDGVSMCKTNISV